MESQFFIYPNWCKSKFLFLFCACFVFISCQNKKKEELLNIINKVSEETLVNQNVIIINESDCLSCLSNIKKFTNNSGAIGIFYHSNNNYRSAFGQFFEETKDFMTWKLTTNSLLQTALNRDFKLYSAVLVEIRKGRITRVVQL